MAPEEQEENLKEQKPANAVPHNSSMDQEENAVFKESLAGNKKHYQRDPNSNTQPSTTTEVYSTPNDNMAANPSVIGLTAVQEMFKQIKEEMTQLRAEFQQVRTKQTDSISHKVMQRCEEQLLQKVDETVDRKLESAEVAKLKQDLRHFKFRNRALTNVVDSLSTEVMELKSRMENVELNNMKTAVSITGLEINDKKEQGVFALQDFFENYLGLIVIVEDYFKIGTREPKLTVVSFQSMQHKWGVLKYKNRLKGQFPDGKPVYINDYTPAATLERRRKEKDVIQEARSIQSDPPISIKYVKGKLNIQGETYAPKIHVPTPKQIVDLNPADLDEILKMQIHSHGKVIQDKSVFEGYTAAVDSYDDIRKLYVKMKLIQPQARHIVCSFWIQGPSYQAQDYCDDGEPGAGRVLLNFMLKQDLQNRVFFITRQFGGLKMGANRFDCYKDAAQIVIKSAPWNSILKTSQGLSNPDERLVAPTENMPATHTAQAKSSRESAKPKRSASSPLENALSPSARRHSSKKHTGSRKPQSGRSRYQHYFPESASNVSQEVEEVDMNESWND